MYDTIFFSGLCVAFGFSTLSDLEQWKKKLADYRYCCPIRTIVDDDTIVLFVAVESDFAMDFGERFMSEDFLRKELADE